MRNWKQASSKSIMLRIQREVRLAGDLSCRCEHSTGRARKRFLAVVNGHLLGALVLIMVLKERCANSFSTSLSAALERIEIWVLQQFGKVCACQRSIALKAA